MKNRIIPSIRIGSFAAFSAIFGFFSLASAAPSDQPRGLGNIVSIEKRADGMFTVTCDYGDTETVSRDELYSGNVCEAVEGLRKTTFAGMTFSGSCQLSKIDFVKGVVGTKIAIVSLAISKRDVIAGCSITNRFTIPNGYQLGLRSFNLSVSLDNWQEGEGLQIMFNGGETGGVKQQKNVEQSGASIVKVALSRYFYTPCATKEQPSQQLAYDLLLNPANNKMKVAGTAGVYTIEFTDAKLLRCD